ncbi:MAG: CPBP family intramembrane glutamic endopeptidase, partial [bacterium]
MEKIKKVTGKSPVKTGIVLTILALGFRILDIFIFRLDEVLGEIILSKAIGFIIVVVFLLIVGKSLKDIGYHKNNIGAAFLIGGFVTLFILFMSYLFEYILVFSESPKFILTFVDPKAGITGGFLFGLILIIGNLVNCFMEESLFRGVLIPLFGKRYNVKASITLSALVFGLWHIPWAVKWYMSGVVTSQGEFLGAVFTNFAPQFLMGIIFGLMYYYTDSLWTPWISHFFINTTLNVLHTSYSGKLDPGMVPRMGFFLLLFFLSITLIIWYTNKRKTR